MDYLEIVLDGFFGEQQKYLDRYFGRKQKEADEKGYSSDEFFDGCKVAMQKISQEINRIYNRQKSNANQQVNLAIQYGDKDIEDQWRHIVDTCNLYDFNLDLWDITNGKYTGSINQADIDKIENALNNAITIFKKNASPVDKRLKDPPAQLITNLSEEGIKRLHKGLIKLKCISDLTDLDSFIWVFGGKIELAKYIPISWIGAKNLCAYFVETFNGVVWEKDKKGNRNRIKEFEYIFNINGIRGAMGDYKKTGASPALYKEIDILIKKLL
jgi:hypothetical protein